MSSNLTTFNINDVVFVDNIGYGVLVDCGPDKTIALPEMPIPNEKKESIYFDPDLFNSDLDCIYRKKSEAATIVPSAQPAPLAQQHSSSGSPTKEEQSLPRKQSQISGSEQLLGARKASQISGIDKPLNIVKVKMQQGGFMVFTPDYNIRKNVIVPVRPLFLPAMGTINIKIEIGKTIQSFKREIFTLLGLKFAQYYNVKFYTTSPTLIELSAPGKTIWQCAIKQSSTLVMTAEHGFCFENVPAQFSNHFATANNNLSFVSLPKVKAIPDPPPSTPAPEPDTQVLALLEKVQTESSFESPVRTEKKKSGDRSDKASAQLPKDKPQESEPVPSSPGAVPPPDQPSSAPALNAPSVPAAEAPVAALDVSATTEASTGAIEAPQVAEQVPVVQQVSPVSRMSRGGQPQPSPQKSSQMVPDVQNAQDVVQQGPEILFLNGDKYMRQGKHYFQVRLDKQPKNPQHLKIGISSNGGHQQWIYTPFTRTKETLQDGQVVERGSYGGGVKQGQVVGVLVRIDRGGRMSVSFYKNGVGMGVCWQAQIGEINFVFGLGSEAEISLDTRIQQPLDSYRF